LQLGPVVFAAHFMARDHFRHCGIVAIRLRIKITSEGSILSFVFGCDGGEGRLSPLYTNTSLIGVYRMPDSGFDALRCLAAGLGHGECQIVCE
jgi:hypothetical protein